jgi:hypothetical protein
MEQYLLDVEENVKAFSMTSVLRRINGHRPFSKIPGRLGRG